MTNQIQNKQLIRVFCDIETHTGHVIPIELLAYTDSRFSGAPIGTIRNIQITHATPEHISPVVTVSLDTNGHDESISHGNSMRVIDGKEE